MLARGSGGTCGAIWQAWMRHRGSGAHGVICSLLPPIPSVRQYPSHPTAHPSASSRREDCSAAPQCAGDSKPKRPGSRRTLWMNATRPAGGGTPGANSACARSAAPLISPASYFCAAWAPELAAAARRSECTTCSLFHAALARCSAAAPAALHLYGSPKKPRGSPLLAEKYSQYCPPAVNSDRASQKTGGRRGPATSRTLRAALCNSSTEHFHWLLPYTQTAGRSGEGVPAATHSACATASTTVASSCTSAQSPHVSRDNRGGDRARAGICHISSERETDGARPKSVVTIFPRRRGAGRNVSASKPPGEKCTPLVPGVTVSVVTASVTLVQTSSESSDCEIRPVLGAGIFSSPPPPPLLPVRYEDNKVQK
eukprot:Hpha_TRINITY_DN1961_c0_g1::TRINITY_DN1961_c0_g1_i1::g.31109::m.31109